MLFIYFSFYNLNKKKSRTIILKKIYSQEIIYKGKKLLKSELINNYLSKITDDNESEKEEEIKRFKRYYYLAKYSKEQIIKSELKTKLLTEISRMKNKIIKKIDIFYLSYSLHFGNNLLALSNTIFYCEVVGCYKIILNKNLLRKLFIRKSIYIKKSNITIILGHEVNCKDNNILCLYEVSWCIYYPKIITPQLRINLIKEEIIRNLPKVNVKKNDLYIHIRGGDIFNNLIARTYSQPPLCFYKRILDNNKNYENIYIVSKDKSNIVLDYLLTEYNNIIFKKHYLEYDISLLCNAYNIVISVSSFVLSSIKLNDNLKNLWEFDLIRLSDKFLFFHHHIFKYKIRYTIHTMNPSENYRNKMFKWKKTKEQIKLMLEDKCPYDFVTINP